jgi:hypothetical protein
MVQVLIDIPDELVHDMEDTMNIYELSIDELVVTAVRHLVNKRQRKSSAPLIRTRPLEFL